uniref:Uncharacterized protein n=1 Tax=Populus trichocarpa TaxID=3694 RepID=A0A2K2C6T3_POPTR
MEIMVLSAVGFQDISIGDTSLGYAAGKAETGNRRTGLLGSGKQSLSEIKKMDMVEADEFVLGNWKSQGTTSGMFVLDGYEVLFPMVQVGTHHFRSTDGPLEPPSSSISVHSELTVSTRGFGGSLSLVLLDGVIPDLMEDHAKPDYATSVKVFMDASIKEMIPLGTPEFSHEDKGNFCFFLSVKVITFV